MTVTHTYQRHVLLLGLVVIAAGLVAASDALHEKSAAIIALAEALISQHTVLAILLFLLLAMASAMLGFFSSAILVPISVYAWGTIVSFMLLWIGWLLGGMLSFVIGRYLGRSVASKLIGHARISNFEQQLSQHARFIHILLFQAAVPSEIPGYVLGILRFRFGTYATALAITEFPYAIGTVYLGASFLERKSTLLVFLGVGGVLASTFAYHFYRRLSRFARTANPSA